MAKIYCVMWAVSPLKVGGLKEVVTLSLFLGSHPSQGGVVRKWGLSGEPLGVGRRAMWPSERGGGQGQSVYTRLCVGTRVCLCMSVGLCWGCAPGLVMCVCPACTRWPGQVWGLSGGATRIDGASYLGGE